MNVAYTPTRCRQPLNHTYARNIIGGVWGLLRTGWYIYLFNVLTNEFFAPTVCQREGGGHPSVDTHKTMYLAPLLYYVWCCWLLFVVWVVCGIYSYNTYNIFIVHIYRFPTRSINTIEVAHLFPLIMFVNGRAP